MDIKNIARNLIPFAPKATEAKSTRSKTDADNDREGNGQASGGEGEKKRHLTPEELQDAIKHLEGLAGVKDNQLTVRLQVNDGITVILVQDRDGKVVRRIPESEIPYLTANKQKKSGNLLNRAL
jgi:uncharacterized FlaG/YvyC family protein